MQNAVNDSERSCKDPAARHLQDNVREILQTWERETRKQVPIAREVQSPILVNTLPLFVSNLAYAIDGENSRTSATEGSNVAEEHGAERARLTNFNPSDVLLEYRLLKAVIVASLRRKGMLSDSVRDQIEISFEKAIEEAVMAFHLMHTQIRDHFVATLSHDLRTPVSAANLSAELLNRILKSMDPKIYAQTENYLKKISANLSRCDRLIQNILDTTLSAAGVQLHLHPKEGDLRSLAQRTIEESEPGLARNIQLDGNGGRIFLDPELIRRALENLINNAVKYGTPEAPVKVKAECVLGRALLSVHNQGEPIPLEGQGRLFQAHQRTAEAVRSGKKGWGLGLAFVRSVCEAHGGSIGVITTRDEGTTFTIDVPADATAFVAGPLKRSEAKN